MPGIVLKILFREIRNAAFSFTPVNVKPILVAMVFAHLKKFKFELKQINGLSEEL